MDDALDEKPALEFIPRGETAKGEYRNDEIGLTYTYPTTWETSHDDPAPPAKGEIAQRAWDVLESCSLLLVRLTPSASDPGKSADRQITLRAVDQTCLGLPAPISASDQFGAEELGAYLQMLGAFGEVRSTSVVKRGNQLFAEYSGVAGEHHEARTLGQRRIEAMAVTRHRKLLLVWMWTASSPAELVAMPKTSASFEDSTPIELSPAPFVAKP